MTPTPDFVESPRLRGDKIAVARLVWAVIAVLSVGVYVYFLPFYYRQQLDLSQGADIVRALDQLSLFPGFGDRRGVGTRQADYRDAWRTHLGGIGRWEGYNGLFYLAVSSRERMSRVSSENWTFIGWVGMIILGRRRFFYYEEYLDYTPLETPGLCR